MFCSFLLHNFLRLIHFSEGEESQTVLWWNQEQHDNHPDRVGCHQHVKISPRPTTADLALHPVHRGGGECLAPWALSHSYLDSSQFQRFFPTAAYPSIVGFGSHFVPFSASWSLCSSWCLETYKRLHGWPTTSSVYSDDCSKSPLSPQLEDHFWLECCLNQT